MSTGKGTLDAEEASRTWTFLSNHAHVLLCLAQDPELRLRDVSERVGITERAVQRIVADLEEAGYLVRARTGRRNRYEIHPDLPLRHPIEAHRKVQSLLELARPEPSHPAPDYAAETSRGVGSMPRTGPPR